MIALARRRAPLRKAFASRLTETLDAPYKMICAAGFAH